MKARFKTSDPDIVSSYPALMRAAREARLLAKRTKTPFYVLIEGRLRNLNARRKRSKSRNGRAS
jgi:hypothetical protein